ncbi:MAG: histidine phosphatase family protein [Propionibacteriaceae bacterium]|nr:histidine phosphatase family protein [Propionibacteriaceae bacterium]
MAGVGRRTALRMLAAGAALAMLTGCVPSSPPVEAGPFPTAVPTGVSQFAPDGTSVIFLVRHGRTVFNEKNLVQGWSDAPLTAQGQSQASAAGAALKDVGFSAVLTSDLGRARQTTDAILAENVNAVGATELPELREQNYGGFEGDRDLDFWVTVMESTGHPFDPSRSADPGDFWSNPDAVAWYGDTGEDELADAIAKADPLGQAEDWAAYSGRMRAALTQLTQAAGNRPGNVLVVTHGGTIAKLLALMDPANYDPASDLPNGSVSVVYFADGRYTIQQVGIPTS